MTLKCGSEVTKIIEIGAIRKLGCDGFLCAVYTMAVSVAVCELFSVKKWCDLKNMVIMGRSRSLEMAPFDRSHTSSYCAGSLRAWSPATAFHGVWDSAGPVCPDRTAIGQRSFAVNGPRTWNSLPADLRTPDTTLCSFKRHLKTYLFQQ